MDRRRFLAILTAAAPALAAGATISLPEAGPQAAAFSLPPGATLVLKGIPRFDVDAALEMLRDMRIDALVLGEGVEVHWVAPPT